MSAPRVVPGKRIRLRSLNLAPEYRRGHPDMVRGFWVPCLTASRTYLRAAGYFTSHSLALVAAGLPAFIDHGGSMRLLASPYFEADDVDAIRLGVRAFEDVVERALLRAFDAADSSAIVRDRLGFLAWLIAEGRLEIRIALPVDGTGLYHEKYGVFIDDAGDSVAFTGSANETRGGLETNFESIDVFTSWTEEEFRVGLKKKAFERAWDGKADGLRTVRLPDAVRAALLRLRPAAPPVEDPLDREAQIESGTAGVEPRDYQLEAVEAWMRAGCKGVLDMATGTGKTITALLAVRDFATATEGPVLTVVAAPYVHLVDQWAEEMEAFGLTPVLGYGSSGRWLSQLRRSASDLKIGLRDGVSCVLTHDALRSAAFGRWFASIDHGIRTLLVADEVHNLGATSSMSALWDLAFAARLGLSATPERWSDDETTALFDYFGPVVYEFPLARAIAEDYLVPYRYFPHFVELTDLEMAEYVEISRRLARLTIPSGPRDEDAARLEALRGHLLRERSAVLNNAEGKRQAFRAALAEQEPSSHTLVYTTPERIDETVKVVSETGARMVHRFTYREAAPERRRLLGLFASGRIDVLVAIRCLDEGVDVPQTETAFILASSSNSREFIQRRGRILRRSRGKTSATIHDFIAIPSGAGYADDETWRLERRVEVVRAFWVTSYSSRSRICLASGMIGPT